MSILAFNCCILSLSVAPKGPNNSEDKNNKANNNKMANGKKEGSRTNLSSERPQNNSCRMVNLKCGRH